MEHTENAVDMKKAPPWASHKQELEWEWKWNGMESNGNWSRMTSNGKQWKAMESNGNWSKMTKEGK